METYNYIKVYTEEEVQKLNPNYPKILNDTCLNQFKEELCEVKNLAPNYHLSYELSLRGVKVKFSDKHIPYRMPIITTGQFIDLITGKALTIEGNGFYIKQIKTHHNSQEIAYMLSDLEKIPGAIESYFELIDGVIAAINNANEKNKQNVIDYYAKLREENKLEEKAKKDIEKFQARVRSKFGQNN